ncbi:hypothetical protein JXM67_11810 [candidate division WOR-3 bacterium]|nr:hypothetical protein [candidate division WOR-3 bacterium]
MPFSDAVIKEAWKRSGGKCECTRGTHGHAGRCPNILVWEAKGNYTQPGSWDAYHSVPEASGGPDSIDNCEIMCSRCIRMTAAYKEMPVPEKDVDTPDDNFLKKPT